MRMSNEDQKETSVLLERAEEQDGCGDLPDDFKAKASSYQHQRVRGGTGRRSSLWDEVADNVLIRFGYRQESARSSARRRLNIILIAILAVIFSILLSTFGFIYYKVSYVPRERQKDLDKRIKEYATRAKELVQKCQGITWQEACDTLGGAGARRRKLSDEEQIQLTREDKYLLSDDPTITYDSFCLKTYRINMYGNITFPYKSSQLLASGGNHTMALFIQHGALRNAENYFCGFKQLMLKQTYRPFEDILIIAPDFNYEHDALVFPRDAFWNSSKPWGDWRVGAESDPKCCGGTGRTVSSFDVLDQMLAILTSKRLFPRMEKISYVGHSAGAQMVQRYAIMSKLAALWQIDPHLDVHFIIANPSSYTYLDKRRYEYNCGKCECNRKNCTCSAACTDPLFSNLGIPSSRKASHQFPCYQWNYDRWPYGIGRFDDKKGRRIHYALQDGPLGVERALRIYPLLHVSYLVGHNDTCNDGLPVCDESCWKRDNWEPGEWQCFRNQMDARCPAMLQGPCRRTRARQYMRYLHNMYGRKIHELHEIPNVGHDASGMYSSEIGLRTLFHSSYDSHENRE